MTFVSGDAQCTPSSTGACLYFVCWRPTPPPTCEGLETCNLQAWGNAHVPVGFCVISSIELIYLWGQLDWLFNMDQKHSPINLKHSQSLFHYHRRLWDSGELWWRPNAMDESEIFVFSRAGDSGAKYGENGGRDDPAGELALTLGVNESTATRGGGWNHSSCCETAAKSVDDDGIMVNCNISLLWTIQYGKPARPDRTDLAM